MMSNLSHLLVVAFASLIHRYSQQQNFDFLLLYTLQINYYVFLQFFKCEYQVQFFPHQ